MSNNVDLGSLSTVIVGYQEQLSQMSMALMTGAAVLLYANRKSKKISPLTLTVAGGICAGLATFEGLKFIEKYLNNIVTGKPVDPSLAEVAGCELLLIVLSTIFLSIGAFTSELD